MFQKIKVFTIVFIAFWYTSIYSDKKREMNVKEKTIENSLNKSVDKEKIVKYEFQKNDVLSNVLMFKINVLPSISYELVNSFKNVWNPKKIKEGDLIELKMNDGEVKEFVYRPEDNPLLKVVIYKDSSGYKSSLIEIPYKREYRFIKKEIKDNLFLAFEDINKGDYFASFLSDIFAWEIDFNSEIRKGDSVIILYESIVPFEGEQKEIPGDIVYARFKGKYFGVKEGFLFEEKGGEFYYDRKGASLKKGFLKSPLPFTRITSKFSYRRMHPILKKKRPHYGIDYGAPVGTPVKAIADGYVNYAGWKGGYGNYIRIKHANGYETGYGHLKKIRKGIYRGRRVKQGEVIGWVGMTGLATGPHLHFEILKNGRFMNFLRIKSPPREILSGDRLKEFKSRILEVEKILNHIENKNKIS